MPIDFSKINLSVLPRGGNVVRAPSKVVKAPPKRGRIDYGAIKLSNIYTHAKVAPKPAQKIPVSTAVRSSTPFIGRPLVTPVEQQRMKAATPKPTLYQPGITPTFNEKGTVVKNPETQKAGLRTGLDYFNRYTETALSTIGALTDTYAGYAWNKDTWSIAKQRIKDSYSQIWSPPALEDAGVPAAVGRAAGNVLSLAGEAIVAWQMGKAVVQTGKQLQTTNRRIWGMEQVDKVLTATDDMRARLSAAGEGATVMPESQSYGALISSVAKASENPSAETMGQMMSDYATAIYKSPVVGPTLRSALPPTSPPITNALARLAGTLANPNTQAGLASFASTLPATINPGMAPIPMPAGLVHSTAPAIPMGGKTQPALAASTPIQEVAPQETTNLITKPWPKAPAAVARPVQAPTVKSYADIMAKEEAMGARLNTAPRVVDKTIPAIDVKKANLVDVTAKVDLKSVQVKFPTATNVFVDTKRGTVLFTNGATPLEAIGVDKPQLKTWYGIDGAKLLGEITRPVVAQIAPPAPTLSKMGTPAVKEPWEMTRKEFISAEPKMAGVRGQAYQAGVQHSLSVKQALAEGKSVPPEVLADYPDLSTTPQKGTATTISNQKTSISTSTPITPRVGTQTGASEVKWGKWIDAVDSRRTDGVGGGDVETIKTPITYRLSSGMSPVRAYAPTKAADKGISGPFVPETGKRLELKGDPHTYYLTQLSEADAAAEGLASHSVSLASYRPFSVLEADSGNLIGYGATVKNAIGNAQETINNFREIYPNRVKQAVADHGEIANPVPTSVGTPASVPTALLPAGVYVQPTTTAAPQKGMRLADTKTSITYTIDQVVKPKGGQVAWVIASDRHGNSIKVDGDAIGERYALEAPTAPSSPITSTSAPASAPAIGNAAPAHGLIDYSRIELNGPAVPAHAGTTSQTSPKVLASVGNAGKGSRVGAKGFDNYIQNTPGTKDTSLSPFAKFKAIRDGYIRFIANEYNWFFKSPLGGEWMTIAVAADDIMLEEYKNPFFINEAGEQVFVGGEFAPAILSRYLKASDVINKRYLQDPNGVDLVDAKGKKIHNPNYGKPDFGVFLQNLQRAGIPIEATKELGADKTNLAQQHIADARMNLVNFQKNLPQLFTKYMAQAQEIGDANARLLPEFYKGIISPETYANDKANPHYYVSLSAGKTDIFDRSSVAPLERAHGLTNLDEVVPPLEGLMDAYVAAIRAQGINRAKIKTVEWNKSSEVATTVLSDSIVHLWKDGVDRAFEVHDKDAGASIRNLTRSKWEVPSLVKMIFTLPTTLMRLAATGVNIAFGAFNPVRDIIQAAGLVPFTPTGLVKGTVKAFKSPGLSQWSKDYRDPTRPTGTKVTEAVKKIVEFLSIPSNVGESLGRSGISESIKDLGGTYLDQFYGYHAGTGFFALHGTFFNDFISGLVPFTRATIAVVRAFYRNSFYGLPIGDKGGTFSGKQGTEKILGKNFLATIIFTLIEIAAIKAAGKEKEYKLLRDRASNFYLYQPSGNWVRLSVPILSAPIKAIVESLYGFESDPIDVAEQTLNVIPGLGALMLPPVLTTYLQYEFNINFFTGSPINTKYDTPAKNPLEAAIMKLGYTEEQADMALRSFFADIPSQVQYVFEMVTQGTSTQAFPLTKRFIVKDPTTSSNAAVDDFYALVDAVKASKNPALEHYVNGRASDIGKLIKNAKAYPAEAKLYMTTATDNIIATFATIAENPDAYGIKKYGPFSWRPSGNYEELAP